MARNKKDISLEDESVSNIKVLLTAQDAKQFDKVKESLCEKTSSNAFRRLIPIFFRFKELEQSNKEQANKIRTLEFQIEKQNREHRQEIEQIIKKISDFTGSFAALQQLQNECKTEID